MGWNDPGRGQDPWGRKGPERPFDLDAWVQRLWRGLHRRGRAAPPRWVFAVTAFAILIGWLATGFYSVPPGNRGVLLQMGQEVRIVRPGAHWRWPAPFASSQVLSVREIHIVAIGYRHGSKLYEGEPTPAQASMLTRDQGIVHLQFAVQYRIANPSHYLFHVSHPRKTIMRTAEAVMRHLVAASPASAVLSGNNRALELQATAALQKALNRYGVGVHIVAVKIQKAEPPKAVEAALERVTQAREDAQRLQTEANGYANAIIPKARAQVMTEIDEAHAYSTRVVAMARGRAARFLALAKGYRRAPFITRERLYMDAMTRVYQRAARIVLSDSGHTVVKVPFAQEPPAQAPIAAPTALPATPGRGKP